MKRQLTLIVLSLFLLAGCHRDEILPTDIKVQLESLSGTRARFTVAPANSHAYYSYVRISQNEENFNAPPVEICINEIMKMEDSFQYFESGSFTDIYCYQGSRQLSLGMLASNTDFKFIVFQINPKTHELIGEPVVCQFHTNSVPTRDLHFEVDFIGEKLQITPSNDNLTYFWQYGETQMIYEDYHSAANYLYQVLGMYQEYGFMEYYYYQGQSVWDFSVESNMVDNKEYTIVICGCEEGEFTTPTTIVKFKYHPGHIEVLEVIEGNEWQS